MKISELIYELESIQKTYGDQDVEFGYKCEEGSLVDTVEFCEDVAVIE